MLINGVWSTITPCVRKVIACLQKTVYEFFNGCLAEQRGAVTP